MAHINSFGNVPDRLSRCQLEELDDIMAHAARSGGDGAIPAGEQRVRERLAEIRRGDQPSAFQHHDDDGE